VFRVRNIVLGLAGGALYTMLGLSIPPGRTVEPTHRAAGPPSRRAAEPLTDSPAPEPPTP
jgi:hypothetical protein